MNQNEQHENLAKLGKELLKEFEAAEKTLISTEFDREWRRNLRREKKAPVLRVLRWTATAAVLAFALVGVLTVATLSIESLRTPLVRYVALHCAPEKEIWLGELEEIPEYSQVSALSTETIALEVYTDGNNNYQLLWANELGQRIYNLHSTELDEEFFWDLGEELMAAGK